MMASAKALDAGRGQSDIFSSISEELSDGMARPLCRRALPRARLDAMDAHARACPASATRTIAQLAAYLSSAARGPEERVRAICFWLHLNVRYDTESYFSGRIKSMGAEDVLRERTSVCHGFARLMAELCKACDIECQVLTGYAKGVSFAADTAGAAASPGALPPYKSNHNWCAVRLYSPTDRAYCWYLVDPTWCSGHVNGTAWVQVWRHEYYLADPLAFAQSHFPEDPQWTLLPEKDSPTWRAFITSVRVCTDPCWDLRILPVSHKRAVVTVPEDRRLRVVLRANKASCFVMARVGDGPHVHPTCLAQNDGAASELLAFTFLDVPRCGGGGRQGLRLRFFASPVQYGTYDMAIDYLLRDE